MAPVCSHSAPGVIPARQPVPELPIEELGATPECALKNAVNDSRNVSAIGTIARGEVRRGASAVRHLAIGRSGAYLGY
jgi:hypothetical protein